METISYALDPLLLTALLAILMLVAWRLGLRMGRTLHDVKGAAPQFEAASMALLGLLLAFAFGTSMSKFDQRRIAVVQDSNAIGDFYTCATLLKEPTRTQLQAVIRAYAEERLRLTRLPFNSLNLESAIDEFERTHDQMTRLVDQALSTGTPIALSLTDTLNAVTSNQASRLAAIRDRLPASVMALLLVSTIITTVLIGRSQGYSAELDSAGMFFFVLLVSAAIYVTIDLNRPERGFIRISQEPIERLVSSMQK
jgi:hypothetical protein